MQRCQHTTSAAARDGRRIAPSTRRPARHTVSDAARAPEVAEVVRAAVLDVRDEGRAEGARRVERAAVDGDEHRVGDIFICRDARRGAVLTPALTRQCGCDTERHFCDVYVFLCQVSKAGFTEAWLWMPSRTLRRLLLRGLIITRRDDSSTSVSISALVTHYAR